MGEVGSPSGGLVVPIDVAAIGVGVDVAGADGIHVRVVAEVAVGRAPGPVGGEGTHSDGC